MAPLAAVGAAALVTCDSFGVWLELASELMAGGNTGFFPAFFWGPVAFNEFISLDAAPEFCAAEALPVRRMPNPRTRASSTAMTAVRAMRRDDHPARISRHSHSRTVRAIASLAIASLATSSWVITRLASVALAIISLASVALVIIALAFIALAIIETSTES